ncbi:MAG TPA: trypsin-like peptidase domain-containing protein [Candidatus Deferrimicrobiaceae bacterium]|nr:trypsin-like peptidase domain-containing protein [Candidatus Deferrimicrobiaceae bacterium]
MSALQELQSTLADVAQRVGPSIVGIGSRQRGSGVVVADGRILTNAHNIRGDEVTVTFADGGAVRGRVAGVDVDGDLAVVTIETNGAKAIDWTDGTAVNVGTVVLGAAATAGGGTRVTLGTVSAVARAFRGPGGRKIAGSIEHTAPLAPGSSGGALLDAEGRFLGLNTNRLGEGFYLALPADAALRERVDALGRGESPSRRRLGVAVAPRRVARRLRRSVGLPERDGVLVRGVEDGSDADRAGIAEGDLIVEVAGRAIATPDDLVEALASAGTSFEVKLVRGLDERTVTVASAAPAGEA